MRRQSITLTCDSFAESSSMAATIIHPRPDLRLGKEFRLEILPHKVVPLVT